MNRNPSACIAAVLLAASLGACTESAQLADTAASDDHAHHEDHSHHAVSEASDVAGAEAIPAAGLPLVTVHKSPTCGCCQNWVAHMQRAGFPVAVKGVDNLNPIKTEVGIPPGKGSCHTAQVGDYFVEGHVPAEDVKRLLTEKPDARGLTVPGMPVGSPGMEVPSGQVDSYDVLLVAKDGSTSVYSSHGK